MTIANFGFNFGCRPDAYITDAFCESIRLALCSGAAPVPLLSPIDGTACPAVAAPLEVECRGAFAALGFSEFYPALCARSDSVHGRSAWQFSARHHHPRSPPLAALPHPVREHPSFSLSRPLPLRLHLYFQARWEFSCLREFGLGSLAFQQQSSLILLLRSSQQLQIVLNHPGSMLVQKLALRVLVSANAPGMPAASALSLLSSGRCALHKQGGTLPPSRERSHIQELRAHTRALRRALGALERTRVQLRVDVATPAWLLLAEPGNASSEAVVVRSKRLVASVALSRQRCTVGRAASAELNTELHSYAAAFELVRLHGWLLPSAKALPLLAPFDIRMRASARPLRTGALEVECSFGELQCDLDPVLLTTASRSLLSLERAAKKQRAVLDSWLEVASPRGEGSSAQLLSWSPLPPALLGAIQRLRLSLRLEGATLRLFSNPLGCQSCAEGGVEGVLGGEEVPSVHWQRRATGSWEASLSAADAPRAREPALMLFEAEPTPPGTDGVELRVGTLTLSLVGAERELAERLAAAKPPLRTPGMERCPLIVQLESTHCMLRQLGRTANVRHAPLLELTPTISCGVETSVGKAGSVWPKESCSAAGCGNSWVLGISREGIISPEFLLPRVFLGRLSCALPLHQVSPLLRRMHAEWKLPAREALHAFNSLYVSLTRAQRDFSARRAAPLSATAVLLPCAAVPSPPPSVILPPPSPLPAAASPVPPLRCAQSHGSKPAAAAAASVGVDVQTLHVQRQHSVDNAFDLLGTFMDGGQSEARKLPAIEQTTRSPPALQVQLHAFKLCLNDAGLHALSPQAPAKEASDSAASSAALELHVKRASFQIEGSGVEVKPLLSIASLQLHSVAQLESPLPHPFGLAAARRYERLLLGLGHPQREVDQRLEDAHHRDCSEDNGTSALKLRFTRVRSECGIRGSEGATRVLQLWVAPLLMRSPGACTHALLELGRHAEGAFRLLTTFGSSLSSTGGEGGNDASTSKQKRAPVLSLRLALQPCWLQPLRGGRSSHGGLLHGEHEPFGSAELHTSGIFGEIQLFMAAPGEEVAL